MTVSRAFPLRVLIVLPFTCLFIIAAIIFSFLSFQNNKLVASSLGSQFANELGTRIHAYVLQLTQVLPKVVNLNADALRNGILDYQQPTTMAPFLLHQIRHFDQITYNTVALADGRFFSATRLLEGKNQYHISANFIEGPFILRGYQLTADDRISDPVPGKYDYDPRTRPFMKCALSDTSKPCWSDIYHYLGFDSFAVSMSMAVKADDGEIIGVTAADIALYRLSEFMRALEIGHGGQAFILDQQDLLIATSDTLSPDLNDENKQRFGLNDFPNPIYQAASAFIGEAQAQAKVFFAVDDENYILVWRELDLGYELKWTLGVILPESEFIAPVMGRAWATILFTLGTLLGLTSLGFWVAHLIARPIEGLSALANHQQLDKIEQAPFNNSFIQEVRGLSVNLGSMAGDLRDHVRDLELRIYERTEKLEKLNVTLQMLSELDSLTGIANRRKFDNKMDVEWRLAIRNRTPLSVIMCDIDHFKLFNDQYGHQAGDEALKSVAQCLSEYVQRPTDLLARYGGEEFVIVLPNTPLQGASELAETMRKAIEALVVKTDKTDHYITLSLGVATIIPEPEDRKGDLLQTADERLYFAKENGRNQSNAGG